jgi:hypothetical protein
MPTGPVDFQVTAANKVSVSKMVVSTDQHVLSHSAIDN